MLRCRSLLASVLDNFLRKEFRKHWERILKFGLRESMQKLLTLGWGQAVLVTNLDDLVGRYLKQNRSIFALCFCCSSGLGICLRFANRVLLCLFASLFRVSFSLLLSFVVRPSLGIFFIR